MQTNSIDHFTFTYTPWKALQRYKNRYAPDKKCHYDMEIHTQGKSVVIIATEHDEGLSLRERLWNFSDMAFQLYAERYRHHTNSKPGDLRFFRRKLGAGGRKTFSPVLFLKPGNFTKPIFLWPKTKADYRERLQRN